MRGVATPIMLVSTPSASDKIIIASVMPDDGSDRGCIPGVFWSTVRLARNVLNIAKLEFKLVESPPVKLGQIYPISCLVFIVHGLLLLIVHRSSFIVYRTLQLSIAAEYGAI